MSKANVRSTIQCGLENRQYADINGDKPKGENL